MPTVTMPKKCGVAELAKSMGQAGVLDEDWKAAVLDLPPGCYVEESALAFLAPWGALHREAGRRIHLRGDEKAIGYLARMGIHERWGIERPSTRRPSKDRAPHLPLFSISSDDHVDHAVDRLCELLLDTFEHAAELVPFVEWIANEIAGNIVTHAQSPVPGALCAQVHPRKHRVDIAICDVGVGIRASLGTTQTLSSHGAAITTALGRGVTRDPAVGQGNGLAGAYELTRRNAGRLRVWSGDATFRLDRGDARGFVVGPDLPGTGLLFALDTRHPVRLEDTWLGHYGAGDWSYLTRVAEKTWTSGGLRVRDICPHQRTRGPARALRNRIVALLAEQDDPTPEMRGPLILDFDGVTNAASSFLDELFGRLAAELGADQMRSRIRCVNLLDITEKMANVVIQQRLEQNGGQPAESPR